jgi:hypothetical protein
MRRKKGLQHIANNESQKIMLGVMNENPRANKGELPTTARSKYFDTPERLGTSIVKKVL